LYTFFVEKKCKVEYWENRERGKWIKKQLEREWKGNCFFWPFSVGIFQDNFIFSLLILFGVKRKQFHLWTRRSENGKKDLKGVKKMKLYCQKLKSMF
jgi:hypothetical protein